MAKKLTKTQKAKNRAAYKNIRKEYDKVKGKAPVSYMQFKHRTQSRAKRDGISIKAAAKREARTETFLTAAERSRENLIGAIKEKHAEAYSELRNLSRYSGKTIRDENGKITKKAGQFESIAGNLTWDKEKKGYILNAGDKRYFIDITNSPEEVNITEIN